MSSINESVKYDTNFDREEYSTDTSNEGSNPIDDPHLQNQKNFPLYLQNDKSHLNAIQQNFPTSIASHLQIANNGNDFRNVNNHILSNDPTMYSMQSFDRASLQRTFISSDDVTSNMSFVQMLNSPSYAQVGYVIDFATSH